MHILLIEDEVKTLQSLKQGLEELQWEVTIAYDGETGLRLARSKTFDVVVSDIVMPQLNTGCIKWDCTRFLHGFFNLSFRHE